jgi:hypothetical protein
MYAPVEHTDHTQTIKKTLSPSWEETFTFDLDAAHAYLLFSVRCACARACV